MPHKITGKVELFNAVGNDCGQARRVEPSLTFRSPIMCFLASGSAALTLEFSSPNVELITLNPTRYRLGRDRDKVEKVALFRRRQMLPNRVARAYSL